jgi:hypothetical protein
MAQGWCALSARRTLMAPERFPGTMHPIRPTRGERGSCYGGLSLHAWPLLREGRHYIVEAR